jgi:hypothetical protein
MAARTKCRAKFDFHGRPFVWWIDGGYYLRISSLDKKFIVAYPLGIELDQPAVVEVIGPEFPGLGPQVCRPAWFIAPPVSRDSMGAWVSDLLTWSFDATRALEEAGPPRFTGGADTRQSPIHDGGLPGG